MFFGRNEEEGLRCVYHGWKFDTAGVCVDMPSEPAESNFKNKVRPRAYPVQERNGILWAYLGPREVLPPLPDLEANMAEGAVVNTVLRDCNWMQALEGDIDTVHFIFLHYGHLKLQDTYEGGFFNYQVKSPAAGYAVNNTDFGTCYGAYRPAEPDTNYWRIANFMFPFYTQVPPGTLAVKRQFRAWVPMDDDHTMFWGVSAPLDSAVENDPESQKRSFKRVQEMLPDTTGWYGRSRPKAQRDNDYLLDREFQRSGESYTGLPSVFLEDQAITESMGTIYERDREHLGTSDTMIIYTRRALLRAARALRETGETPLGVDQPEVFAQRSGGVVLPRSANWFEATAELRKAFVHHTPDEIQASLGRRGQKAETAVS
jgi:phenylpropionate dioxygenase-like ring-hydroxylating dioxygenase large terminal subunit